MTQKLKTRCAQFTVIRTHQRHKPLQQSEHRALHLPRGRRVLQRQVLLLCDSTPVVFAHTVTDSRRVSRDWPFFNGLGHRALGVILFADPLIHRQAFEFTRLSRNDAMYHAAVSALQDAGFLRRTTQPVMGETLHFYTQASRK